MKGVVIKSTGSWYTVDADDEKIYQCRIVGKFRTKGIESTNPVSVGDKVEFKLEDDGRGVINKIHDRKNYIIRKSVKLSKRSHILAANVDQAIMMVTLAAPKTYTAFIDRFLVTAEAYHVPAILIFNKIDLYDDAGREELKQLMDVYEEIGYPCYLVSATEKINIEPVKEALKDKVSLITGHSGVGKSTLINLIEPGLNLKTAKISESHDTGLHTTTFAEMHKLSEGGYIIDTPGLKAFGLIDFEKEELFHRFPEMRKYMDECKFHNCVHINEPGCAVKRAVGDGEIAEWRYMNYLDMYEEDEKETYRGPGY